MTRSIFRPLLCVLLMPSAAHAVADQIAPPTASFELTTLSTATALSCDAMHTFSSQLRVCDADGCTQMDVTGLPSVSFALDAGQSATLTTSVAYEVDGVVYGNSETHDLGVHTASRFAQTVAGNADCLRSVYYQLDTAAQ